jgi:hypothetical protein
LAVGVANEFWIPRKKNDIQNYNSLIINVLKTNGSGTMRCIALISGCSLHQKQDLLAFGSIVLNLICLLSLNHEIFYRL